MGFGKRTLAIFPKAPSPVWIQRRLGPNPFSFFLLARRFDEVLERRRNLSDLLRTDEREQMISQQPVDVGAI